MNRRLVLPVAVCVLIGTVGGCSLVPAHADGMPAGQRAGHVVFPVVLRVPVSTGAGMEHQGGRGGLPPVGSPALRGGVAPGLIYDSPVTGRGRIAGPALLVAWRGAPNGWSPPATALSRWDGTPPPLPGLPPGMHRPVQPDRPSKPVLPPDDVPSVPGPLPVLGAAAAWGWARKLRRRVGT